VFKKVWVHDRTSAVTTTHIIAFVKVVVKVDPHESDVLQARRVSVVPPSNHRKLSSRNNRSSDRLRWINRGHDRLEVRQSQKSEKPVSPR
jgi:hypothetical protein